MWFVSREITISKETMVTQQAEKFALEQVKQKAHMILQMGSQKHNNHCMIICNGSEAKKHQSNA